MSREGRGCFLLDIFPGKRNKKGNKENDKPVARHVENLSEGEGRGCCFMPGPKTRESR